MSAEPHSAVPPAPVSDLIKEALSWGKNPGRNLGCSEIQGLTSQGGVQFRSVGPLLLSHLIGNPFLKEESGNLYESLRDYGGGWVLEEFLPLGGVVGTKGVDGDGGEGGGEEGSIKGLGRYKGEQGALKSLIPKQQELER